MKWLLRKLMTIGILVGLLMFCWFAYGEVERSNTFELRREVQTLTELSEAHAASSNKWKQKYYDLKAAISGEVTSNGLPDESAGE